MPGYEGPGTQRHVLEPVGRRDQVLGERMPEKVVWQLLQPPVTL
jgi:hypothetical protein